jgi:membrane-bound metal-dependent hydrolase YbcI (DUF457 family)
MNSRTHLLVAMFFGFLYFRYVPELDLIQKFVFASFLISTSLLPDIDLPTSSLGKKHHFISAIVKHRGIFHAVWIPLIALGLSRVYPLLIGPLMGIFMGYSSHLFSDMLTKEGIKPFTPLLKWKIRGPMKTGGMFETIIAAAIVMFFLVQPF